MSVTFDFPLTFDIYTYRQLHTEKEIFFTILYEKRKIMDNNHGRMGKERNQQHRSPVFKLLRKRRNQPTTSSLRLADPQDKNRNSVINHTKTNNKRSK